MRVIYISDLVSDTVATGDEQDADDVAALCTAMQQEAISLEVYALPRDLPGVDTSAARAALKRLADASPDAFWSDAPAGDIGQLHTTPPTYQPSLPQSAARCTLDLGPHVSIPVWTFNRVVEAKLPSLKTYMATTPAGQAPSAADVFMEVYRSSSYYLASAAPPASGGAAAAPATQGTGRYVAPEDTLAAYRYGKDLVPLQDEEVRQLHYTHLTGATNPGRADEELGNALQLVGFTPLSRMPRHMWLGASHLVTPVPAKSHPSELWGSGGVDGATADKSAAALGALAHVLAQSQCGAVVRRCTRKGADVRLAVLTAMAATDGLQEGLSPALVMNVLPFSEDVRMYPFAPLPLDSTTGATQRAVTAVEEAAAAADALVASMMFPGAAEGQPHDFAATGDNRAVLNPTIQRVAQCVKRRAGDPHAPLVPWDSSMLPQPRGGEAAHAAAVAFAAVAPTKARQARGAFTSAQAGPSGGGDADGAKRARMEEPEFDASVVGLPLIGALTPGADFAAGMEELASKQAPVDSVLDFIRKLCDTLWALLDYSGAPAFPQIIAALPPLRAACVARRLAGTYNQVLQVLRDKSAGAAEGGIWGLVQAAAAVGPITTGDVGPSVQGALSEEEGAAFMARKADAVVADEAATLPLELGDLGDDLIIDDGGDGDGGDDDFDMD
jgi:hypothetical protein